MDIRNWWFIIGIVLFIISFLKNTKIIRLFAIFLFLFFVFIASNRGINFNDDTRHYVTHFSSFINSSFSFQQLISWNWGIGYNSIAIILAHIFSDKYTILFFITLIPGIIFSIIFYKYKYHPSIIFFIYATMLIVVTTATMRHWWALSISFFVLNHVILLNKNRIIEFFYPMLFHYSTIPLVIVLLFNKFKESINLKHMIIVVGVIIFILIIGNNSVVILYKHFINRASSGGFRIVGFRNIINLFLIFLILFSFKKLSINFNRIDFLLIISIIMTIIFMPLYGVNRVVSFFTLIILIYFHKYKFTTNINFATIILSLISLVSLIYFYTNYSIEN